MDRFGCDHWLHFSRSLLNVVVAAVVVNLVVVADIQFIRAVAAVVVVVVHSC